MEEDTLFEKLKESVWLSRRKIRRCTVKKEDHAETRISWNSIWNELKKTDWCASEELTQRLKVWYSFSEPSDMACDKREKRDLSHTLPSFMIKSLVHSEDHWDQEPSTEITSPKKDTVLDKSEKELIGKSIQQQIDVAQAQQSLKVSLESGASSSDVYQTERQTVNQSLNSFDTQSRWLPPKLSRLNHLAPEFTPAKTKINPVYKTNAQRSHTNQKYKIQSKAVVKEHWCPPGRPPVSERMSIFIPRAPRETFTERRVEQWNSEKMETKSFRGKQAYPPHETFTQRNVEKRTSKELKTKVITSKLGAPIRSSFQDFQLRLKHSNANYLSPSTSCVRVESPRDKRKVFGLDNPNPNPDVPSCKTKPIYHKRNRRASWKKKGKYSSPSKEVPAKPKGPVFPPKDYICEKGDWLVHAIVSLSSKPEDVKSALEKRGYKLKYILKRKCNLPNKWVCSLIASADRTHILTSENIWLNSWEVEFVCSEEEIAPFLGSPE